MSGQALSTPPEPEPDTRHAYHLYTVLLDIEHLDLTRDEFLDAMTDLKIGVGVHYIALHLHPFYQKRFGYQTGDFPEAEWVSARTVSLPISAKLSDQDVSDVIWAVKHCLKRRAMIPV